MGQISTDDPRVCARANLRCFARRTQSKLIPSASPPGRGPGVTELWKNSRRRASLGLLVLFLAGAKSVIAQDTKRGEEVHGLVHAAGLGATNAPGAAVLVLVNGQVEFQHGYGLADLRSQRAIDKRTNFRLASVTKQFTAMAVMLLVHDGKLHYDDRLSDLLPHFPRYGRTITVRELLNHTSGLADYEDLMPPVDPHRPLEEVQIHDTDVLALLEQQQGTKFQPGSSWAYSNSGYVLLGLLVARVSGSPFADCLRDRIFAPLGMTNTIAYLRGRNDVPNRAFGYSREGKTWMETDQGPTSATLGDGGVYSSIEDLAKWDRALRQNTLLNAREMQPALTPAKVPAGAVREPDGSAAAYGFGWFLNPYHGEARMWHYGESIGFRTAIQRFPAANLTIVVLANRADLNPSALALRIADLYLTSGKS